jgi:AraC-like DNA-binding protein
MTLGLSLLEIISVITAFQLLMLGFVLLSKGSLKKQSNRILSLFMFSNALLLIYFLFSILDIINLPTIPIFYYLLGPLMYLYVGSMCASNFIPKHGYWVHGVLPVVMVLFVVGKAIFIKNGVSDKWEFMESLISQIILHIQIASYIIASFLNIYKYRKEIKNHFSSVEQIDLSWLLLIVVAFTIMWFTDFVAFIIDISFEGMHIVNYYLIVASITINMLFANYLVYKGLNHADAFSGIKAPEKYSGSKITNEDGARMVDQLKDLMLNKKPYLNPDLNIKDLSEEFNIHHKFLSQIINSQFGQNYYDFVNYYRIEEAKEIITKNNDEKMTILEILYEAGFNSKSAFNNAFKKSTGITPSEFKRTG